MNKRIGFYALQKVAGEPFNAYVPPKLPPDPSIDVARLYPDLEKATHAVAQLNSVAKSIPNVSLFLYMYVRKEALLSSQIEGTQSSFADLILFEDAQNPEVSTDDVEEVSNYVKAIKHGLDRIKGGFSLSLRLLREVHGVLLAGSRGATKLPGEFRRSQNWIGGSRPGNAMFVPPDPENMMTCLSDMEKFLHDKSLPILIKAGLVHVQFETIHPFLDGNGRLGRLLIILMLCEGGLLDEPILYLSLYLKQNRSRYYDLLGQIRTLGNWEVWLEFFLEGVCNSAQQGLYAIKEINALFEADIAKIESLGRVKYSCLQTFEYMKKMPQLSVPRLAQELEISAPTARSALNTMVNLGVLEEVSGKKRDRVYVYRRYLSILENGAEPLR